MIILNQVAGAIPQGRAKIVAHDFEPGRLIWDQLVLLNNAWHTYTVLYEGLENMDALLDRSARWFFRSHHRLLVREILLAISRLTDPESTSRNRNLVLATILQDPGLDNHPEVRGRLRVEIDSLVRAAEPVRRHRHKYIAHLDHETAMGNAAPPPPVSRQTLEEIIRRAEAIYHEYSLVLGSDVSFELAALGNAEQLIRKLEDAERWARYSLNTLRTQGKLPEDPQTAA
jgi:hypothetical protein